MKKHLLSLLFVSLLALNASPRSGIAVSSHNWNQASTWNFNGVNSVPNCGDTVTIPNGITVTINAQQDYSSCSLPLQINVSGTLQMKNGFKLTLPANSCVNILSGGVLQKSTSGGGNSTALIIDNNTLWNAGMGPENGPVSLCDITLPITLLRFEATAENDIVKLQWTTASEVNNQCFIIERTSDGKSFEEITKVNGSGNSTNTLEYETKDLYPLEGLSYYRLKQIDFDGKYTYSDLVGLLIKPKTKFDFVSVETTINSTIKISFNSKVNELCTLQVVDLSGNAVFNLDLYVNTGLNKKEIYCPFLKKGVYILTLQNSDQLLSKKISFLE